MHSHCEKVCIFTSRMCKVYILTAKMCTFSLRKCMYFQPENHRKHSARGKMGRSFLSHRNSLCFRTQKYAILDSIIFFVLAFTFFSSVHESYLVEEATVECRTFYCCLQHANATHTANQRIRVTMKDLSWSAESRIMATSTHQLTCLA